MLEKTRNLSIHLNDHLAGSVAGLNLAKSCLDAHEGTDVWEKMNEVRIAIEEDQQSLKQLMSLLDIRKSLIRQMLGWTVERMMRLKFSSLAGRRDSMIRLQQLEGLLIGVRGKLALWHGLGQLDDNSIDHLRLEELQKRALDQLQILEELHRIAAGKAFS